MRRTRPAARMAAARSPKVTAARYATVAASLPAGIPAPAAVLVDTGQRQRMQRLHQQRPQARHRRGQVRAHPPGDAAGPEEAVVPGAFRHTRRKRSAERSIRPVLNVVSAKLTSSFAGVAAPASVIVATVRSSLARFGSTALGRLVY